MARNHFAVCMIAALALGACSGKKQAAADAEASRTIATLRAHNDSIRGARAAAAADSVAHARYATCVDSVTAVVAKAPVRGKTKVTPAAAAERVTAVCGTEPVTATLAAAAGAQPAVGPDSARADSAAPVALTPKERELARADSLRHVRDATKAAAARLSAEQTQADSMRVAVADSLRADSLHKARETEVERETFAYGGGVRDPFSSLINLKSEGPELADLQLVAVYQDLRDNANSVAVLREKTGEKRHKVRVGDQLGRLRVSQIRPRDVVFQIEDFGFERQETLSLRKQEDVTP